MTDADLMKVAIEKCGTQLALAELLEVSRLTVIRWAKSGHLCLRTRACLQLLLHYPEIFVEITGGSLPEILSLEQRVERLENLILQREERIS